MSRGYGFATFATTADIQNVLQRTVHHVSGKPVTLKLADAPGSRKAGPAQKIFIGGVDDTLTEDAIRGVFSQFGNIINVTLLKDQAGRSRGFGFMAFDSNTAASAAMAKGMVAVNGVQVTIKSAAPKRTPRYGGYRPSYPQYGAMRQPHMMQMQQVQQLRQRAYGSTGGSSYGTGYRQPAYNTADSSYGAGYRQQGYNTAGSSSGYSSYSGYGGGKTATGSYGATSYARRAPY